MHDRALIQTLNHLIETCKDGEYDFRVAAEHMKPGELRTRFERRAEECAMAAANLVTRVLQLGGEPETGGTAVGTIRRRWAVLRGKLAGYTVQDLLEQCESAEDAAMDRYREALRTELPDADHLLVSQQYEGVKRNHAQVHALREDSSSASARV